MHPPNKPPPASLPPRGSLLGRRRQKTQGLQSAANPDDADGFERSRQQAMEFARRQMREQHMMAGRATTPYDQSFNAGSTDDNAATSGRPFTSGSMGRKGSLTPLIQPSLEFERALSGIQEVRKNGTGEYAPQELGRDGLYNNGYLNGNLNAPGGQLGQGQQQGSVASAYSSGSPQQQPSQHARRAFAFSIGATPQQGLPHVGYANRGLDMHNNRAPVAPMYNGQVPGQISSQGRPCTAISTQDALQQRRSMTPSSQWHRFTTAASQQEAHSSPPGLSNSADTPNAQEAIRHIKRYRDVTEDQYAKALGPAQKKGVLAQSSAPSDFQRPAYANLDPSVSPQYEFARKNTNQDGRLPPISLMPWPAMPSVVSNRPNRSGSNSGVVQTKKAKDGRPGDEGERPRINNTSSFNATSGDPLAGVKSTYHSARPHQNNQHQPQERRASMQTARTTMNHNKTTSAEDEARRRMPPPPLSFNLSKGNSAPFPPPKPHHNGSALLHKARDAKVTKQSYHKQLQHFTQGELLALQKKKEELDAKFAARQHREAEANGICMLGAEKDLTAWAICQHYASVEYRYGHLSSGNLRGGVTAPVLESVDTTRDHFFAEADRLVPFEPAENGFFAGGDEERPVPGGPVRAPEPEPEEWTEARSELEWLLKCAEERKAGRE